jgi:hypothetical protein
MTGPLPGGAATLRAGAAGGGCAVEAAVGAGLLELPVFVGADAVGELADSPTERATDGVGDDPQAAVRATTHPATTRLATLRERATGRSRRADAWLDGVHTWRMLLGQP